MSRLIPLEMRTVTGAGLRHVAWWRRTPSGDQPVTMHIAGSRPTINTVTSQRPFYVAWRCGGASWPPMSKASIDGSIAAGYEALEISVNRCATGEFVCIHDSTTDSVTGQSHVVRDTPWSVLSGLSNGGEPLLRLPDALDLIGDRAAIVIDNKPSSWGSTDPIDLEEEQALLGFITSLPGDLDDHFMWKTFGPGFASRDRARQIAGLPTLANWYESDLSTDAWSAHQGDATINGMDYAASLAAWSEVIAAGRPTIAHIINGTGAASTAISLGADGLMCGIPAKVHP